MLRALARALAMLREAGFDDDRAARTLNTVVGYACGYAAMEVTLLATGVTALRAADQFDSLVKLAQALPPGTAPELVLVIVGVDDALARRAGELADQRALPGYDAVHLAAPSRSAPRAGAP